LAQTGSWTPAGADTSYPRTLLKASALPGVQAALATGSSYSLYSGLYASVPGSPPGDNTVADGRRARATFAKNAAFVLLMNRKPVNGSLEALSPAEASALLINARSVLESINTSVEVFATFTTTPYNEWQWRSKELIDYLIAYDLLRGAGVSEAELAASQAKLQEFAANLYTQSTKPFLGIMFYSFVKNNHTLMTAAALGMAAVVLNHVGGSAAAQQPSNWINTGLYNVDNVLWQDAQCQASSTTVAGYAEGPYYFKYAFLNCLPFFRAMGNFLPDNTLSYTFGSTTRSIRNPYYDPKYDRLYDWITVILMPDGRFPALEDSYVDMGMPELALTGKSRYVKPLHFRNFGDSQLNTLTKQLRDATVDMRAAYLAANLNPTAPTAEVLTALPESGNLIFRSGNDSLASYLHVYGKHGLAQTNSGGHSQGDASSFILHAKGQLLALDPGYLSYGRRAEVGNANNHNLILVDGAGPTIGAPSAPNDAEATIQNTWQTPQLAYGEVKTTYPAQSTTITRKTLFIRKSYYLMADFVAGAAAHTYTWQLHGYGLDGAAPTDATGAFTNNLAEHEGTWQKNGASLRAHVTATGGATAYTTATKAHEVSYNATESHTALLVEKSGGAQTQFLAALYPFTTQAPTFSTASDATTAALASAGTDYLDLAFAQADTVLTTPANSVLPQTLQADGLLNLYSVRTADNAFAQLFLEQGKQLVYGATTVVQSSQRATISWQQDNTLRYKGYVSRSTILTLSLDQAPSAVSGAASYSYDAAAQQLRLAFDQGGSFIVALAGAPLPVALAGLTGQREAGTPVLSWHTASEHDNRGFTVQRRSESSPTFEPVGFVAGAGTTSAPSSYRFRDASAPATTLYYRLEQTDLNGQVTYSPILSIAGNEAAAPQLTMYPVPAHAELNVSFANPAMEVQLRLLNQKGQVVLQEKLRGQTQLDVSRLAPGLYFLQALDAAGKQLSKTQKLTIE
jgi:hypothetical protein